MTLPWHTTLSHFCGFILHYLSMLFCCHQAMQEFAHLCQEKDAKIVLSVLPLWPKVYAKLSIVSG